MTSSWRDLQAWIGAQDNRVTIPFAPRLAELVPPVAVRLRRDFATVLNLIKAHAVLHQRTRERDAAGRIVATLADYAVVRDLDRRPRVPMKSAPPCPPPWPRRWLPSTS